MVKRHAPEDTYVEPPTGHPGTLPRRRRPLHPRAKTVPRNKQSFARSHAPQTVCVRTNENRCGVRGFRGTVEGTVWTHGETVESVGVTQPGNFNYVDTEPASDGTYRLSKVPTGEAEVFVRIRYDENQGIRVVRSPIIVEEGKTTKVDFDLPPATGVIEKGSFSLEARTSKGFTLNTRWPQRTVRILDSWTSPRTGSTGLSMCPAASGHCNLVRTFSPTKCSTKRLSPRPMGPSAANSNSAES